MQPIPRRFKTRTLAGGAVLLVAALALIAVRAWNRPLGPELVALPTATLETADAGSPVGSGSRLPTRVGPLSVTPTVIPPTPTPSPECGGPAVMYILVIGRDTTATDYSSGFADAIRVVRVDFVSPSVTMLSVPRDLWVRIPGLESHDIIENRIKTAYDYGYVYDVPGGGPSLLAQTLSGEFGLYVDHYVVINFAAFVAGIDAIGGVDIDVPEAVGNPQSRDYIPAGPQHMDGRTLLRYVRARGEASDMQRIDRQTQAILAIRERVLHPQILSSLPGLIESMQDSVLTDLSPSDISKLVCIGRRIEADSIRLMGVDRSMVTPQVLLEQEILLPDYEAIRRLVQAFNAGGSQ